MIQTERDSQRNENPNLNEERRQPTNLNSRKDLVARLRKGRDARVRFVESHLAKGIAFQLRSLRDRDNLSQQELAQKAGTTQNAISRLESSRYGKPTLTTLKKMADVFDVALVVRFIPFSQLIDWVSGTPHIDRGLSTSSLQVPDFGREENEGVFDYANHAFKLYTFPANALANTAVNMSNSIPGTKNEKANEKAPEALPRGIANAVGGAYAGSGRVGS